MAERTREEWLLHAGWRAAPPHPKGIVADGGRLLLAFTNDHRKAWRRHFGCPCMHTPEYAAALAADMPPLYRYLEATHLLPAGFVTVRREPYGLFLDGPGVPDRDPAPFYRALEHLERAPGQAR